MFRTVVSLTFAGIVTAITLAQAAPFFFTLSLPSIAR
jgi:hypothetical protein